MGLLDGLFGATAETDEVEKKYAILMNAGPENVAPAGNGFQYALELDDAGYDVEVYLDGIATRWPGEFAENPNRSFSRHWRQIQSRGLVVGACGYCANAFDQSEACEANGVAVLSGEDEHAPALAKLAEDGYEFITVG